MPRSSRTRLSRTRSATGSAAPRIVSAPRRYARIVYGLASTSSSIIANVSRRSASSALSTASSFPTMSRVLVTGSADGLGRLAAQQLIDGGHEVVLHARNRARAADAVRMTPGARAVLVGDLSSIRQTRGIAEEANASGRFDAVIHNVGVGFSDP